MITAICQALVYQASKDYDNKCLSECFNMEYLNDGLWKAARFPLETKMIDPESSKVCTLADQVNKMKDYIQDSLIFWGNQHINKYIDSILKNGTEADKQLKVYEESGLEDLKQYLIQSVEYQYK
jgi:carboxylate-amine ligase